MKNQNRALLICRYLWEHTDEGHPATIAEIMEFLKSKGVTADRKTIANDCRQLQEDGYDVVCNKSRQNQYFNANQG